MSIFNESPFNENPAQADAAVMDATQAKIKAGANWFFWIAALSLINSIVLFTGGNWNFFVGLAITQVIDAVVLTMGGGVTGELNVFVVISLMIDIIVAAFFAIFGYFGGRGSIAMLIIGIVFYVIDGMLYLALGAYLAAGFHAFALFYIVRGLMGAFELRTMRKNAAGSMMQG